MRNFAQHNVNVFGRTSGKVKTICELCLPTRKNKKDKSLLVNLDTGRCQCFHCGAVFYVPDEEEERRKAERFGNGHSYGKNGGRNVPDHYRRPVFDPSKTTLSERTERWLVETRCIPQQVIKALQITEQEEMMPQTGKRERCICFNYFEFGQLVNTKFRTGEKHFKMVAGAELIPYNIDSLTGERTCIITEGELDAASCIAAGYTAVVSVPAGANANLKWIDRFLDTHFDDKEDIVIAVDTDRAGLKLRDELVNRLGAERCRIATWAQGCKDANEHLVAHGIESLRIAIERAEDVPLEGIITASDLHSDLRALYDNGFERGADTGWEAMDKICTYERRRLVIVTGVPGSGKSEFVDELVVRLCLRHDWKVAFFSPENVPIVYHLRKLAEKVTGKAFQKEHGIDAGTLARTEEFLSDNFCHISLKDRSTPERVLAKAREAVKRRGCKIVVLDPLNRFEHNPEPGQTETQYLSNVLNKLTEFAAQQNCLVILVAHPRKMNRNPITGVTPRVEMYDISGSADFYNKADYGLVVERDREAGVARVHVEKVKFKHLGQGGTASFIYEMVSGRYFPCTEVEDKSLPAEQRITNTQFDTANWLPEKTLF